ncbi:MAG: carboxylesterase/lipase family protein, partial [Gammaproteobacteria bacterium]
MNTGSIDQADNSNSPITDTTSGPVRGRRREGVLLFAGIPYAAPPVGEHRFMAPQPHTGWREPLDATRFSPAAPQVPTGGLTSAVPVPWSEDCLTLNITTPALDGAPRPVLFWIHGGHYRTGQGSIPWYDGTRFARDGGVVVVTINYRLGALGFTDLSRFGAAFATSGANGIADQIAALRWVQANIAAFGGDPARVTIAGESAGAFSVCTLLASPAAEGLFRGAIAQSGGAHNTLPKQAGVHVADALLTALGVDNMPALAALSAEQILAGQRAVIEQFAQEPRRLAAFGVPVAEFYPVEGNPIVPEAPINAIRAGRGARVAVLAGSNRDETTLWGYGKVDEGRLTQTAQRLGAEAVLEVYRHERPGAAPHDLMVALTTDHDFRIPAIRLLEARMSATPATQRNWLYWFTWPSRAFGGRIGATHALEIPFAFNNLDRSGVDVFIGPGERPDALAETMQRAWIR